MLKSDIININNTLNTECNSATSDTLKGSAFYLWPFLVNTIGLLGIIKFMNIIKLSDS